MAKNPSSNFSIAIGKNICLPAWLVQLSAPIISAALFTVCFPPFNFWPVAFFALVPCLLAILTAKNSLQARASGFAFGFLFYGFALHWLWNVFPEFPWFAILLWAILALFTALFALAIFLVKKRFGLAISLTAGPFLWLGIEYFRSECWWLKFAWMTPGFSQASNLPLLQSTSLFGVYGVSALILAVNSCLCYLLLANTTRQRRWMPTLLSLGIVALLHLWGSSQLQNPSPGKITAGAIQTEASSLPENIKLTQKLAGNAQLIVWPEYSLEDYVDEETEIFKKLSQLAAETRAYLIVGAKERAIDRPDSFYNTALLLSPDGKKIGSYYKNNTVQFFNDGIPGKNFPVFQTQWGKLGIAICYDMDFPHVFRNLVKNGAEILAVPTYDAMWWSSLQHQQHSAMAPARAVEYRRWMVRAASSGISQIIDPYGRVQNSLDVGLTGTVLGKIDVRSDLTFYARVGYLLPRLCLVVVLAYFGYELAIAFRQQLSRQ